MEMEREIDDDPRNPDSDWIQKAMVPHAWVTLALRSIQVTGQAARTTPGCFHTPSPLRLRFA